MHVPDRSVLAAAGSVFGAGLWMLGMFVESLFPGLEMIWQVLIGTAGIALMLISLLLLAAACLPPKALPDGPIVRRARAWMKENHMSEKRGGDVRDNRVFIGRVEGDTSHLSGIIHVENCDGGRVANNTVEIGSMEQATPAFYITGQNLVVEGNKAKIGKIGPSANGSAGRTLTDRQGDEILSRIKHGVGVQVLATIGDQEALDLAVQFFHFLRRRERVLGRGVHVVTLDPPIVGIAVDIGSDPARIIVGTRP